MTITQILATGLKQRRRIGIGVSQIGLGGNVVVFVREIDLGFLTADFASLPIVSSGCLFRGVEGTKPNSNPFSGITNLRGPFAPRTLPDASVEVLPRPLGGLLFLPVTCL